MAKNATLVCNDGREDPVLHETHLYYIHLLR